MASIAENIEVLKSGLARFPSTTATGSSPARMSQQREVIAALDLLGDFLMRVASISISLQKIEENTRRHGAGGGYGKNYTPGAYGGQWTAGGGGR